jgi:hypothetical protein
VRSGFGKAATLAGVVAVVALAFAPAARTQERGRDPQLEEFERQVNEGIAFLEGVASASKDLDALAAKRGDDAELKALAARLSKLGSQARAMVDANRQQLEQARKNLIEARRGSNEASAIGALRTLTTAQSLFREGDKDKNGLLDYSGSLEQLGKLSLIDGVLASGKKQGYRFVILQAGQFTWSATAEPVMPGETGKRSFFVDESGVIRFSTSGEATSLSSPVGG